MPSLEIRTNGGVVRVVMPYDGNDYDKNDLVAVLAVKVAGIWSFRCNETELPEVQRYIDEYEKPCRAEVLEFAKDMELKLRANDHKGGWNTCSKHDLAALLLGEVMELLAALGYKKPTIHMMVDAACDSITWTDYQADPKLESIDVGAISMMIHDNLTHSRF